MGCGCDEQFTGTKTDCSTVVCLGKEDMCLGCGETKQNRYGKEVTITKVNAAHIMLCESGKPVEYYLQELRRMFPYIECGLTVPTLNIGLWEDAEISAEVDSCAIGLPGEVTQRIPFMEGDVTRHNDCLWISLINDNLTEPTEATQNEKKWLCLSSIDSRFDLLEQCCEEVKNRLTPIEACLFPEGGVPLCDRVIGLENAGDANLYWTNFTIRGDTITLTRNDGHTKSVTISHPASAGSAIRIPYTSASVVVNDPAPGSSAEGLLLNSYTAPAAGLVDITATVEMVLTCNSASPSAAIDGAIAIYQGSKNLTGWRNISRVSRYNPATVITKRQSTAVRAVRQVAAGAVFTVRVRNTTIVERGNHVTFSGMSTGTFHES